MSTEPDPIRLLKAQAQVELDRLEAHATAREEAAKVIGKQALVWIFLLVLVGVKVASNNFDSINEA